MIRTIAIIVGASAGAYILYRLVKGTPSGVQANPPAVQRAAGASLSPVSLPTDVYNPPTIAATFPTATAMLLSKSPRLT